MSRPQEMVTKPETAERPVVSVVLVCDYASAEDASWGEARATLQALAVQDFHEKVEYLLVEQKGVVVPKDVLGVLSGLRLIRTNQNTSFAMKNEGRILVGADQSQSGQNAKD